MTKRERLYHSLVKSGKLFEHKLAKKKLKYAKLHKKPQGIYIDLAVLRELANTNNYTVEDLIRMSMEQNIFLSETIN